MKRILDKLWHKFFGAPYRLHVHETGRGKPLVLLHGLGGSGQKWRPLIELLDEGQWRILAPDLLGFGASPKPEWNAYNVEEHARNVISTLKRQKLPEAAVLVGHSMGCLVAVHIATTHPHLVKRLILYQPPLFADDPSFPKHSRARKRYFAFFGYMAERPQWVFVQGRLLRRIAARISGLTMSKEGWLPFSRSLQNTIMGQRAYDELHSIAIPTDIIYGRLDFVVTRAEVKKMFAHNKRITLHLVTEMHDITPRSAAYIMRLVTS